VLYYWCSISQYRCLNIYQQSLLSATRCIHIFAVSLFTCRTFCVLSYSAECPSNLCNFVKRHFFLETLRNQLTLITTSTPTLVTIKLVFAIMALIYDRTQSKIQHVLSQTKCAFLWMTIYFAGFLITPTVFYSCLFIGQWSIDPSLSITRIMQDGINQL
jgi:hypothetical protein